MAQFKVYDASWLSGHPKVWNGSAWVGLPKLWDGTAWVPLASTLPAPYLDPNGILAFSSDFLAPFYTFAGVRVGNDGDIYNNNGTGWNVLRETTDWLATADKASAGNGDYECKLTGTGDSPGTLNTWQDDTFARSWSLSRSTEGNSSFSGTLYIRKKNDASSEVSCSVSITCNVGTL